MQTGRPGRRSRQQGAGTQSREPGAGFSVNGDGKACRQYTRCSCGSYRPVLSRRAKQGTPRG